LLRIFQIGAKFPSPDRILEAASPKMISSPHRRALDAEATSVFRAQTEWTIHQSEIVGTCEYFAAIRFSAGAFCLQLDAGSILASALLHAP